MESDTATKGAQPKAQRRTQRRDQATKKHTSFFGQRIRFQFRLQAQRGDGDTVHTKFTTATSMMSLLICAWDCMHLDCVRYNLVHFLRGAAFILHTVQYTAVTTADMNRSESSILI